MLSGTEAWMINLTSLLLIPIPKPLVATMILTSPSIHLSWITSLFLILEWYASQLIPLFWSISAIFSQSSFFQQYMIPVSPSYRWISQRIFLINFYKSLSKFGFSSMRYVMFSLTSKELLNSRYFSSSWRRSARSLRFIVFKVAVSPRTGTSSKLRFNYMLRMAGLKSSQVLTTWTSSIMNLSILPWL